MKTIVVDYGFVRTYSVSVVAHDQLNNVTEVTVKGWFEEATEEVFLKDQYPENGSIRDRYENSWDVNCPIALVLGELYEFKDIYVEVGPPAPPGDKYKIIDNLDEWTNIKNEWKDPVWGPNDEIDVRQIDIIMVESIYDATGRASQPGFNEKGQHIEGRHIWMGTDDASVVHTLAHEFGHYRGDLDDTYICDPSRAGCGRIWRECICICGNCNQVRQFCGCQLNVKQLPPTVDDPNCPDNFMGKGSDNAGLLSAQRDALLY